jgi:hypothetical protein
MSLSFLLLSDKPQNRLNLRGGLALRLHIR